MEGSRAGGWGAAVAGADVGGDGLLVLEVGGGGVACLRFVLLGVRVRWVGGLRVDGGSGGGSSVFMG